MKKTESITSSEDWNDFYTGRKLSTTFPVKPFLITLMDEYVEWTKSPGKIFELGCGGSRILAKSGLLGWEISGIDWCVNANNILRMFAKEHKIKVGKIIDDDALNYGHHSLVEQYDVIFSSSFLCHFLDPVEILFGWRNILKQKGVIICSVPNLDSFNGQLMRLYDNEFWNKHATYSAQQIDKMHLDAGFEILKPAYVTGGYYVDFYIPWEKIKKSMPIIIYKLLRYFSSYVFEKIIRLTPFSGNKLFNPFIIGVYGKG